MLTEGLDAHCSQCILVQKVWRIRTDRGEDLENSRCLAWGQKEGNGCVEDATRHVSGPGNYEVTSVRKARGARQNFLEGYRNDRK